MQNDQEFYISVAIIGGIVFAGSLIIIGLTIVGIAIFKKQKQTKELYNGKEKENGQARGGSRGSW